MKRPLLTKIIFIYGILTVLVITMLLTTLFTTQLSVINENALSKIKINSYILNDYASNIKEDDVFNKIDEKSKILGFKNIAVISEIKNEYVYGSNPFEITKELSYLTSAISKLSYGADFFTYNIRDGKIDVYLPIVFKENIYVCKLSAPFDDSVMKLKNIFDIGVWIAIATLALHIFFAIYIYFIFFKRINKISEASVEISKGNYEIDIFDDKRDELSKVVNTFGLMSSTIDSAIKNAFEANALTHLPGNHVIDAEIKKRMAGNSKYAVIYTDLDNFKAYNDTYGVSDGDQVILMLKHVLEDTLKYFPSSYIFVGHVGGDDFIIVLDYDLWLPFCMKVASSFDYNIPNLYNETDRNNGFIMAKDRKGELTKFKLCSVSLAVVSNKYRTPKDYNELIVWASEMKKYVKLDPKKKQSNFLEDTRVNEDQ